MAASSSSSPCLSLSPSFSQNWDHDVFPSFHGRDVRKSFLSHILKEFKRKSINMFIDNNIKRGEFIGPELKLAIRGSKIAIVLLSKNYASSSWCLDELVEIMKKNSGQIVISVFYDVDPTHVRKQIGYFGEVFRASCEGQDNEKIQAWRKALEDVATIAGYHSSAWDDEASMIDKIVVDISNMLNHFTPSRDFDNCIGLENHMKRLKPLLDLDSNEVVTIGIWGPPGIGKTTIVRFLFSVVLSNQFQNRAFMEDVKRSYQYPKICFDEHKAKLELQSNMMSKMTKQDDIVVSHLGIAQQRLRNSKVLLVLDDVDRSAQIDALAKNDHWFGAGSRIIITTENLRLLKARGINHIYKVDFPSFDEALEMFCMYAFEKKSPDEGFDELACEIIWIVGNLPLGLKVIGSHFRGLDKDNKQWSMEVSRLSTDLNGDIESILKFSYDALCDEDKDLFLHIACFCHGRFLSHTKKFLAPKFKDLRQRLSVLEEKSLIYVGDEDSGGGIEMHELLVQLGKKIVREELFRESGKHQFLNDYKDACQMLTGKEMPENLCERNLRVVYDSGHPIIIFWIYFRSTCLDFTNNLEFLVELHLLYSELEKLWDGTKLLRNLKILDLSSSYKLKELPNLSMATNLEELYLKGCSNLLELPSSIRNATKLKKLNIEECSRIVSLPQLPESLSYLNAKDCKSLQKLNCSFGNAVNELHFTNCFNLNKKARDLIIRTSTHEGVCVRLPDKEVPACFTYRACESFLTVKLNQKHLSSSTKFKACVLIVYKGKNGSYVGREKSLTVTCSITSKEKNLILAPTPYSKKISYFSTKEHLYIFDIEAWEVTSTELDFTFELTCYDIIKEKFIEEWEIKECGVLSVCGDSCYERVGGYSKDIFKRRGIIPYSVKGIISFVAIVLFLTRRRIIPHSMKGILSFVAIVLFLTRRRIIPHSMKGILSFVKFWK